MKKLWLISVLLILVMAVGVEATTNSQGNLTILNGFTAAMASVNPGATATGNFTMNNIGTQNITDVVFTSSQFTSAKYNITGATFNDTNARVEPSAPYNVQFNVAAPSNAYASTYTGTVYANDSKGNSDFFQTSLTVNADPNLTATNPLIEAVQSQKGSVNFSITNTGNTDLTVSISLLSNLNHTSNADSIPQTYVTVPSSVTVPYGESKNVEVSLNTNLRDNQTTGLYSTTLRLGFNGFTHDKTLQVNVLAQSKSVSVPAQVSESWVRTMTSTTDERFDITNTGNVPLNAVTITWGDLTSATGATISKSLVTVNPSSVSSIANGGKQEIIVSVSGLPSDQALGTYIGTMTVDFGGSSNASLQYRLDVTDPKHDLEMPGSIALGSTSQERNTTLKMQIQIRNNGDFDENGLNISLNTNANASISFDDNFYTKELVANILKGANKTVYIKIDLPLNWDTGKRDFADLVVSNANVQKTISDMTVTTKSYLIFDDADIDYETDSESIDNGETIENIRPGVKAVVTVDVKNLYDEDDEATEDMDINDVEVRIEANKDLGDEEVDEESSNFDLDPEETKEGIKLEFDIPADTDTGTYTFTLTAEGTDKEGAKHKEEIVFYIEVEKEDHSVIIDEAELAASTLSCTRETYLDVTIKNVGDNEEDHARLRVTSSALGLDKDIRDIALSDDLDDDDSEYSTSIPIYVDEDVKAGSYKIEVTSYYDDDRESDDLELTLKVESCGVSTTSSTSSSSSSSSTSKGTETNDIVIKTPGSSSSVTPTTSTSTSTQGVVVTERYNFRDSSWYTGLLIVAVIVVLFAVVTVAAKGLRKPKFY